MNDANIRIELLKIVIPQSSKVGLTEPELMIDICKKLEKYVVDLKEDESQPDSSTARKVVRLRKGQVDTSSGSTPDPTHGGQVESNPR
jgi:hypothetical protein